ncbi:odorant receptor 131-2-like [Leuresthes tenuis]|uniref:odorant receptor 131-2-like n=1 Tax=Leuresthes tenuis TaxID=355514 RepID=UPI003B5038D2
MNSSRHADTLNDAFTKNFISFTFCVIINCINGSFVYIYHKSEDLQQDSRYVLYIHLVINDMIMLTLTVTLQILTYTIPLSFSPCCILLLIIVTSNKNSPLNLAGMAVERYIAVCHPFLHTHMCTVHRAYALIALIWSISFVPAITDVIIILATQPRSFFSKSYLCYPSFVYNTPHHEVHSVLVQVLLFSFVFLTLLITYLKVVCTARAISASNQASAKNARNTIFLHGIQLLLCMLSYFSPIINLIMLSIWPNDRTKIFFCTFLFTSVFPRLLSPLIYGVRDQKFSSRLKLYFCCNFRKSVE